MMLGRLQAVETSLELVHFGEGSCGGGRAASIPLARKHGGPLNSFALLRTYPSKEIVIIHN